LFLRIFFASDVVLFNLVAFERHDNAVAGPPLYHLRFQYLLVRVGGHSIPPHQDAVASPFLLLLVALLDEFHQAANPQALRAE